jgi:hypothetical protein
MKLQNSLRLIPLAIALAASCAIGQQSGGAPPVLVLQHVSSAEMSQDDRSLLEGQWPELTQKAQLFGYSLDKSRWSYRQVLTPVVPDYVMLQFERSKQGSAHGSSAFTAFVERDGGRVWIVPVLYGGEWPWHSAVSQERSRLVFNRVVPREISQRAFHDGGMWLAMAQTYAEMAGYHPEVLAQETDDEPLMTAPEPTAFSGNEKFMRLVEFSDLRTASGYRLWTISFDYSGRVIKAQVKPMAPTQQMQVSKYQAPTQVFHHLPPAPAVVLHPKPVPW